MTMKFSVVIPLYNKALFIGCALQSVLRQDFTDLEVIVVDDGSTDGSAEVVRASADPRVRLVCQDNAGVSAARNHGIALARGEWVAFLDADDWQHPAFLSTLLRAQEAYPQADTVATSYLRWPHDARQWPPLWAVAAEQAPIELITNLAQRWLSAPTVCSSSVAVRRTRLLSEQPCFPVGESTGEDLDLWFRLNEKAPLALAKVPLAAYRVELAGSLSSFHNAGQAAPFLGRMQQRALHGRMSAEHAKSTLWLVTQHFVMLSREALATGKRGQALRWLLKGWRGASHKRWWLTAATIWMPASQAARLLKWRADRSAPKVSTIDTVTRDNPAGSA